MPLPKRRAVRLLEVVLVVLVLAGITAVLMPTLHMARIAKIEEMTRKRPAAWWQRRGPMAGEGPAGLQPGESPPGRLAHVKTYKAQIELIPKLSVGTAAPESIYEAKFTADIQAIHPGGSRGKCEIVLPLPPQVISLSDLDVTVSDEPNEEVFVRGGALVWQGQLDGSEPTAIKVSYSAVGKGIYTLSPPPGKIVDVFEATLTAHGTDLKMMELSLQPDQPRREAGNTIYTWKYKRLMLGRPIALDILGITPMDKLGELRWLGPISVFIFGMLVGLVMMAFRPEKLDRWMLLLIVGLFAGAYPLMYFAQEFMPLGRAVLGAAVLVLIIIGARAVTLLGPKLALPGVVLLAAAVLVLTLWAAVKPAAQGVVLSVIGIGAFALAMLLLPRAQKSLAAAPAGAQTTPPPPAGPDDPPQQTP